MENTLMGTVFITGGTGFIAQSLIPVLISSGWKVSATARDEKG